jgi:hypothetical protein
MIHFALWPFQKIYGWLKKHFQSEQVKEQIAIQRQSLLLEMTPDLDVTFSLIRQPSPPDPPAPLLQGQIKNWGGKTKITQGSLRVRFPSDPSYDQEKNLSEVEMPKGKKQDFSFTIRRAMFDHIMTGHATLNFEYELHFQGLDGKPEKCAGRYNYDGRDFKRGDG